MKKQFLFLFALCLSMTLQAQTTVTIAAGGLQAALNGVKPTHLVVRGKMEQSDFTYLKSNGNTPQILDLSGVTEFVGELDMQIFTSNTTLEEVIFPDFPEELPALMFANASAITKIKLPNRLKRVPSAFFSGCWKLQEIDLPATVERIDAAAFRGCSALTSLILPAGLKVMDGYETFKECSNLTALDLPENVYITQYEFASDVEKEGASGKLTNTFSMSAIQHMTLPKSVKILESAFLSASSLTSVTIPEGVTTISTSWSGGTFSGTQLIDVTVPNSVTSLGSDSFMDVYTLETVTLGENLDDIGDNAFSNCSGLKTIVSLSDFPPTVGGGAFNNVPVETTVLLVPAGAVEAYQQADGWRLFTNIKAIGSESEPQTISNFEDITTTVGATVALNATASSGLPVTYTIADPSMATLEGNVLTVLKEGETTVEAIQPGDNISYGPVRKTVTLYVVSYGWLEAPAITVEGNTAKVVGPQADSFTSFSVNGEETEGNSADISAATGVIVLRATKADGSMLKLTINR